MRYIREGKYGSTCRAREHIILRPVHSCQQVAATLPGNPGALLMGKCDQFKAISLGSKRATPMYI